MTGSASLTQRNRELSILNAIAESLNRSPDLDQILRVTLSRLAELFDLNTAWVWLFHPDSQDSYLAAAQNLPPALQRRPERMEGSCYCLDTYLAGDLEGAANINVVTCSRLKHLEDTEGLRYHTSIPLYAHDKKLGVLNVASTNWRKLSSEDLRLLHTAGDMLAMAIERARLFNQSRQIGAVEERSRLAREIHDILAQGLTAIAMNLEAADALLESGASVERYQDLVSAALQLTRSTLEEARRSVQDLRAAPLEGRSLPEALQDLAESYRKDWNLRVIVSMTGKNQPLPPRIEVGLYRTAQEALANVLKHANAQTTRLRLRAAPDEIRLAIEDDGSGFSAAEMQAGRFGLVGMNERVRLLGGRLEIQSAPGKGTRLEIVIPL